MKVTYIEHSGFSVETENYFMIFDYFKGDIPTPKENKKTVFFVSHFHEDHYSKEIYSYSEKYPDTVYVLDSDIKDHPQNVNVVSLSPHQTCEFDGITIKTLLSTDTGVAYLVKADGKTVYHAGDLHLWLWNGAPKYAREYVRSEFQRELGSIKNEKIDVAFLPLDPRQGSEGILGFDYAMKELDIAKAAPMHFWEDTEYVKKFYASEAADGYRASILMLLENGDSAEI